MEVNTKSCTLKERLFYILGFKAIEREKEKRILDG
jgi:hypothetical protein